MEWNACALKEFWIGNQLFVSTPEWWIWYAWSWCLVRYLNICVLIYVMRWNLTPSTCDTSDQVSDINVCFWSINLRNLPAFLNNDSSLRINKNNEWVSSNRLRFVEFFKYLLHIFDIWVQYMLEVAIGLFFRHLEPFQNRIKFQI